MDLFCRNNLRELLANHRPPCASLFARTTRGGQEEDLIRWKNLLRTAEEGLEANGQRSSEARELLAPGRALLDDPSFWLNVSDGVAGFLAPGLAQFYRLPVAFTDQALVGDLFQVKQLLPLLSGDGPFVVLILGDRALRILLGTRGTVHEFDLSAAAKTGAKMDALRGLAGPDEDIRKERNKYFHRIDRGINQALRDEPTPLVLAGPAEFLAEYREINSYPHLLPDGVECQPSQTNARQLHDKAWAVVQQHFHEARERMAATFRMEMGKGGPASGILAEVVSAAIQGQIQYLLLQRNLELWGTVNAGRQSVDFHARRQPGDEDLVNLAVVHTLNHRGTIYLFEPGEADDLPGLAAIFWLPLGQRSSRLPVPNAVRTR